SQADYGAQTGSQKLEDIQVQVNDVKGILKDNIDKVLDRGEKLDDLIDKTEDLQATDGVFPQADTFQKTATRVSRKMWWKNTKMIIIIVVIVVIILILIILLSTNVIPT
ncbi:VA727 protein, partial [Amia calva]|nr:VA727 protein [Amia calva]